MTALTMPAGPGDDTSARPLPRPLPWQRMAWVTWRQHRIALAGVATLLGALALYLWLAGLQLHHAYSTASACHPAGSFACGNLMENFNNTYSATAEAIAGLLLVVPGLIGAFTGAPVLGRELETGTFRYTWTLSFGRCRWALGKLVPLAVLVAGLAAAFSALFSWYFQPFLTEQNQTSLAPTVFGVRGVAFAAWTLAAFAIGALAGMLIRRAVPAIATTLAVYAGLVLVVVNFLRQRYLAPLTARNASPPGSAWILGQQWYKGSQPVSQSVLEQTLQGTQPIAGKGGIPKSPSVNRYFIQHGYTLLTRYQPGSRFWPFQWIEGGWLLALSVLLIAATLWLVRRHAA